MSNDDTGGTTPTRAEDILGIERRDGFWLTVTTITPDAARQLLNLMPRQRPLRPYRVKWFVRQLREGNFLTTHQGLAFDPGGLLIDGQHRLHAIVEAGVTVEMAVAFNQASLTFKVIDRNEKRNAADDLVTEGVTDASKHGGTIAAGARTILLVEEDTPITSWREMSHDEVMDVIRRYPVLVEIAHEILLPRGMIFPRGPYAGLFTIFDTIHPAKARQFREEFYYGEGIERGMPSYELRKQVLGHSSTQKLHREQLLGKCVRAWNAHFAGRRLTKLYNLTTGARAGEFPKISGFKGRTL